MNTTYTYRLEDEHDFAITENLTREAFWDVYKPGCDEHLLLHNMRSDPGYIKDLSYLCVTGEGTIAGAIYCIETVIVDGDTLHPVVCIGPLGVLPEFQKRGIGVKLLRLALERSRELGYACAVLYGNPAYYGRSGFVPAARFNIHTPDGSDMDAFMCRPLDPVKLARIKGRLRDDAIYRIDEKELAEFERRFPAKEKHVLPGQIFG